MQTPPSTEGDPRWTHIENAYGQALDLPAGDRRAFLDETRDEDAAVGAEVEALIGCREEADQYFQRLEAVVRRAPRSAFDSFLPPGCMVGPYAIEAVIGRGGMGVVYQARDTRLARIVALKFLPLWLSEDEEARHRFLDEARAASATDHPNIATLYDLGEAADGRLYLAMAIYDGETLRDRLARDRLTPEEALDLAKQVAAGLAAAHRRGIVHRDIKPANLFLTTDGLVKILDFGVATMAGAEPTDRGSAGGTIAYMSPEQLRGDSLDHRTDLWSLGLVLHEATGGQPGVLASVVARLLSEDPGQRHANAEELLRDLAVRTLEPRWLSGNLWRRVRRRRVSVFVSATTVAGLVIGVRYVARDSPAADEPAPGVHRVAVLPFTVRGSPEFEYLGEGIVNLLSTSLDGGNDLRSVDPRPILKRLNGSDVDRETGERLASQLGADRYVLGDIVEAGGRLRIRADLYDRAAGSQPAARGTVEGPADQIFHLVDELTSQLLVAGQGGEPRDLPRVAAVTTSSLPALKAYLAGDRALRGGRFEQAVAEFQRAVAEDSLFALAYYELSIAASWARRTDLALESIEEAARHADRLPARERLLITGWRASLTGNLEEAERVFNRATALYPSSSVAWHELGERLFHYNSLRGRSRLEAEPYFERALRLDPGQSTTLLHLIEIAVMRRDEARFRQLYARLAAPDLPVWGRILRAFMTSDPTEQERALAALRASEEQDVFHALEVVEHLVNPRASREVAQILTEPSRPRAWRALGYQELAEIQLGQGRLREALRTMAAVEELQPAWGMALRGSALTTLLLDFPAEETRETYDRLLQWHPTADPDANVFVATHDEHLPQIRLYLLGLLSVRLGDLDRASRWASELETLARHLETEDGAAEPASPFETARAMSASVRAHVATSRGDHEGALRNLAGFTIRTRGEQLGSTILTRLHERFLHAELLHELGREEEALAWYRSVTELGPAYRYRPQAYFRMAEIYDARGDRRAAAWYYQRFAELWAGCDAELRPLLTAARRRAAELRAS